MRISTAPRERERDNAELAEYSARWEEEKMLFRPLLTDKLAKRKKKMNVLDMKRNEGDK